MKKAQVKEFLNRWWWLWAFLAGFLVGRGWEIVANFEEWRYGVFYRDNLDGTGLISLFGWLLSGPIPTGIVAVIAVSIVVRLFTRFSQPGK